MREFDTLSYNFMQNQPIYSKHSTNDTFLLNISNFKALTSAFKIKTLTTENEQEVEKLEKKNYIDRVGRSPSAVFVELMNDHRELFAIMGDFLPSMKKTLCNRYIFEKTLGAGAYGVVFKSRDKTTEANVAIKCICRKSVNYGDLVRHRKYGFIPREAFILSGLNHPNIIKFVDVRHDESFFYIVTEFPEKGNVRDLFDFIEENESIDESRLRKVFIQVVQAIEYMHKNNYVHRDIKDENVIIDSSDNVFLIDFGAANKIPQVMDDYFTDFCGTPHAMSPEIIHKVPYRGIEQDIWGLGVLLYSLTYREVPFDGHDTIVTGNFRSAGTSIQVSASLKDLISSMLEINVTKRINMSGIFSHQWMQEDELDNRDSL